MVVIWGLCVLGSLVWILLGTWLALRRSVMKQLADQSDPGPEERLPGLVVVFAARDEEAMIEAATRSMASQDYPGIAVVAVDDRSRDGTGAILDRLAQEFNNLKVVHIETLPDGWLGKTWAMESATRSLDADWILLTDGDVVLGPDALRKAVHAAESLGVDHIVVGPEVPLESWGERMFLSLFGLYLAIDRPVTLVENPRSPKGFGVGAFNLVRGSALRGIGGLHRLSLSVDDDLKLGEALKACGYTTRVFLGKGTVKVRWQTSLWGMITGLEKNFFAGVGYALGPVLVGTTVILATGIGPHFGAVFGSGWIRAVSIGGVVGLAALLHMTSDHSRIAWYYSFTAPLGAILMAFALWRSMVLTLRRGGVRWRDHLYPLERLREHRRRREAWLREAWLSTRQT